MNKVLAATIAGLFAVAAHAQSKPAEVDPTAQGKPAARAEAKVEARGTGQVKAPGGDQAKVSEGSGGVTASTAVDAGEARKQTRDERRRNKDGSQKRPSTQGGTPQ